VALVFAVLYVVFTVLTWFTIEYIGSKGLTLLSFISGAGDITPFILNLMGNTSQGLTMGLIAACCLQATFSNNIMKMFYAIGFSGRRKELTKPLYIGFALLSVVNLVTMIFFL